MEPEFDRDGYPTDKTLETIATWDHRDSVGWFDFIKRAWHMSSWGWSETEDEYHISTGGWSGNESIIGAMNRNILWTLLWYSSRRGGHFVLKKIHK